MRAVSEDEEETTPKRPSKKIVKEESEVEDTPKGKRKADKKKNEL